MFVAFKVTDLRSSYATSDESDTTSSGVESLSGVFSNGKELSNVYVFDANGKPVTDVYLYDQDGQPIEVYDSCAHRSATSETPTVPGNKVPKLTIPGSDGICRTSHEVPFTVAIPKEPTP